MKSIENIENIKNKRVILRLDLNVPIKNGKITDSNRIDKVMPTLEFLLKKKAKIIIISHVGRPKGKIVKELSLELVSLYIKSKIKKEVSLLKENIFNLNKEDIFKNSNDELVLLENIRFYPEEEANDDKFSKKLASLGEIYVNDAFSCSHRDHASVYLADLDDLLGQNVSSEALSDALFPFVRQFANHNREWFDSQDWNCIHEWLSSNLESEEFSICMTKYPQWNKQ